MMPVWSSWIAIAFGVIASGSTLAGLRRASRTRSWPSVTGEILEAEVVQVSSGPGDAYRVCFRYRYSVAGREYEGTREDVADREVHDTHDAAKAHAMRCAPGTRVDVFHDPENPDEAVLEQTVGDGVVLVGAIGAASLVYGVLTLWLR